MANKTNPVGIRFDIEKLDLVKSREQLDTNQKVVDFLLNKYWWDHKIPVPTHKEVPPLSDKSELKEMVTPVNKPVFKPKTVEEWIKEKREIELPEQYEAFIDRLNADTTLSTKQKSLIKYA